MVLVKGSKGSMVQVNIKGIGDVMRFVLNQGHHIKEGADFGVVRAGEFIQSEVVESIIGLRAEPKSVDTGQLANSINFFKTGEAQGIIKPKEETYPNSSATTTEVATIMEYGTSDRPHPRYHFGNTQKRTAPKAKDIIEKEIKQQLRFSL